MAKKLLSLAIMFFLLGCLSGCGLFSAGGGGRYAAVKGRNVVETARSQIGNRYRAGGASPQKGFDCSGLVWWSYGQHGVKVPRITTDQAKAGKSVSRKSLKAGDIVIFRTGNSPRGLHSGLYCGNGTFIHSPGSGKKVCIDKLSGNYWKDRLIAIRRVGR